jgi:deoxyribonuclease V
MPTIGCAKSVLVGEYAEPALARGSFSALRDGPELLGSALRTRAGVAPLFVSVGHRVSLASARRWVLRLAPAHRVTEPVRAAHAASNRARRAAAVAAGV